MRSVLHKADIFGEPLPTFNLKGETHVNTITGGLCTFFIIITCLAYGSLKFVHLIDKTNPQLSEIIE